MRIAVACAVAVLLAASPVFPDDASWTVTGRASQVWIERGEFGSTRASVFAAVNLPAVSAFPFEIETSCSGSTLAACTSLEAVPYSTAQCSWSALSSSAQQALGMFLGNCKKTCIAALFTGPGGEEKKLDSWSCEVPASAKCVEATGLLTPDLRIEALIDGVGCEV